jgi:hypothetical protein
MRAMTLTIEIVAGGQREANLRFLKRTSLMELRSNCRPQSGCYDEAMPPRFLRNEIAEFLARRSSYLSTFKRVDLMSGVYFLVSVPDAEVKLMSVGAEVIQSMTLSIDDTKQIFRSIERAYDDRDLAEINLAS